MLQHPTTAYFRHVRGRPDRVIIDEEWISRAIGSPDLYVDLDADGRVVSITIEHASRQGDPTDFTFERIPAGASAANRGSTGRVR